MAMRRLIFTVGFVVTLTASGAFADMLSVSGTVTDMAGDPRWTSTVFTPNTTPVTISGWVDVANVSRPGGMVLVGLIDKRYYDEAAFESWGGAYAYIGKQGTYDVGPSDGYISGKIVNHFTSIDPSNTRIYFNTVISSGVISVQASTDGVNYVTVADDNYGTIKDKNSTTAYPWDEFEYGAYLTVNFWDDGSGNTISYDVTASQQVVPVPSAILLGSIGLGMANWRMRKRKTA